MIIVTGVEIARPQRTGGYMPEWFRPASMWHSFDGNFHDNTFIFAIYTSEWGSDITDEQIKESIKSFPKTAIIQILDKGVINK